MVQAGANAGDAMAFQAVPDVAEAVINITGHGESYVNTLHGKKAGGYDLADLTALAVAVDLAVGTNWLPLQSGDYAYIRTTVRGLAFENDQEVIVSLTSGLGQVAGAALPDNVTLSIKKKSAQTGRSARGRMYWIGMPAANLAANELALDTSAVTDIVAALEAVRVAIAGTVWTPVIVSRRTAGAERPFGIPFDWIDTVAVNADVDSQRRRLRR